MQVWGQEGQAAPERALDRAEPRVPGRASLRAMGPCLREGGSERRACRVGVCQGWVRMLSSEERGLTGGGRSALSSIPLDPVGAVGSTAWGQVETRVQELGPGRQKAEEELASESTWRLTWRVGGWGSGTDPRSLS